jgi:hypothetical protein
MVQLRLNIMSNLVPNHSAHIGGWGVGGWGWDTNLKNRKYVS